MHKYLLHMFLLELWLSFCKITISPRYVICDIIVQQKRKWKFQAWWPVPATWNHFVPSYLATQQELKWFKSSWWSAWFWQQLAWLLHSRGPLIAPTIPPEPMETRCKNREATDINPRAYGSLMLVNYDVPTNSILNCLSLGSSVVMLNKYTQVITVVPCKTKGSGFLSNQLYKSWMYSCAGMRTHLVTLLV